MSKYIYALPVLLLCLSNCSNNQIDNRQIQKRQNPIDIDGLMHEQDWASTTWLPIDQIWVGELQSKNDFSGRYKLLWDENFLFVFAEIVDDTLMDIYNDPLIQYWDDDCLEIFIDEDASKGNHQYNHNAFAYHIALDGSVADIGSDSIPRLYNQNLFSKRLTTSDTSRWEVAIRMFDDSFSDNQNNEPIKLTALKKIGFAIAYCDNDYSTERETFIGSEFVPGKDKNRGWIDAGIFGEFVLKD